MSDLDHVRAAIAATRSQVKASQRVNRTMLQFLADLDEQLDQLVLTAQPDFGGTATYASNGHQTKPIGDLVYTVETP